MSAVPSLTTHVLDTAHGKPASGMRFDLLMLHGDHSHHILSGNTNADGRADKPLLEGEQFHLGSYELIFHVKDYFAGRKVDCQFLDRVPIRFTISDAHISYHVPLLVTPWAYNTYRGS